MNLPTASGRSCYMEQVKATVDPFGGRWLAQTTAVEVLEGAWPGAAVLLEFPDLAAAQAWYRSAEYLKIAHLRSTTRSPTSSCSRPPHRASIPRTSPERSAPSSLPDSPAARRLVEMVTTRGHHPRVCRSAHAAAWRAGLPETLAGRRLGDGLHVLLVVIGAAAVPPASRRKARRSADQVCTAWATRMIRRIAKTRPSRRRNQLTP